MTRSAARVPSGTRPEARRLPSSPTSRYRSSAIRTGFSVTGATGSSGFGSGALSTGAGVAGARAPVHPPGLGGSAAPLSGPEGWAEGTALGTVAGAAALALGGAAGDAWSR